MEAIHVAKETTAIDLACLLNAGEGAVVTLVAGDTRLVAHRAVLMDRSPVFAAMFRHDSLEARSGEVSIQDMEGPVLGQLLSFLYTLKAPQLPDMAAQLLVAADRYGVPVLKAACEQQVAEQLSVETAVATAVLAIRHSCPSLRQAAVAYIQAHVFEVMATRGWADAVHNRPKDVVELSQLLSDSPAENREPAESATSLHLATRPHSGHSDHSGITASAAPASATSRHTPPPDDSTVARLRSLPAEERSRRLREAAKVGAVGDMEALLAAGADVAAEDVEWRTALHWAAERGHVEAARLLVAGGAPVDARDSRQQTPLHWAALRGHAAVVQLLLAAYADHSAWDHNGWTPLHWAAANGNREAAAALLEAGADRAATENEGRTALDVAREYIRGQLVELLAE